MGGHRKPVRAADLSPGDYVRLDPLGSLRVDTVSAWGDTGDEVAIMFSISEVYHPDDVFMITDLPPVEGAGDD